MWFEPCAQCEIIQYRYSDPGAVFGALNSTPYPMSRYLDECIDFHCICMRHPNMCIAMGFAWCLIRPHHTIAVDRNKINVKHSADFAFLKWPIVWEYWQYQIICLQLYSRSIFLFCCISRMVYKIHYQIL